MSQSYSADQAIIEKSSKIIDDTRNQLDGKIKQLEGQMAQVSAAWAGQGNTAFQNVQTRWSKEARDVVQVLEAFQQNLRGNAAQYNADDTSTAEGLNKFMSRLG